jgi:ATP-dependent RNA helicase DeaD
MHDETTPPTSASGPAVEAEPTKEPGQHDMAPHTQDPGPDAADDAPGLDGDPAAEAASEAEGEAQAEAMVEADAEAQLQEEAQDVVEPENALPPASLEALPEAIRQGVARAGWPALTPVQTRAIPYMLAGQEIMVQARTGSGKTGAFVLPLLSRLDPNRKTCQAMVLAPTRELARQVAEEARMLFGDSGLSVVAVYGGVGYGEQLAAFQAGAQLVVGAPGRILDHLIKRNLRLDDMKVLIFDEADRMLSIGFYPDMKAIQRYLPERGIDAFMFSATFPPTVLRLANEFLREPKFLSLSEKQVNVAEVENVFYAVPGMRRDRSLMRIIETENPGQSFIFCNTKADVHYLTEVMRSFGYDVDELSADLTQNKREEVLAKVRRGDVRFLVATDVAARGIDVPELSHVIMYQPPEDPESYIHRAGRTGRAGAAGTVITLVDVIQKIELMRIATRYQMRITERNLPTEEEAAAAVAERLTAALEARLRVKGPLVQERQAKLLPLAQSLAQSEEGMALVAMLLDEYHQGTIASPPPVPPIAVGRPPRSSRGRDEGRRDDRREGRDEGRREGRRDEGPREGRRDDRGEGRREGRGEGRDGRRRGGRAEERDGRGEFRREAPEDRRREERPLEPDGNRQGQEPRAENRESGEERREGRGRRRRGRDRDRQEPRESVESGEIREPVQSPEPGETREPAAPRPPREPSPRREPRQAQAQARPRRVFLDIDPDNEENLAPEFRVGEDAHDDHEAHDTGFDGGYDDEFDEGRDEGRDDARGNTQENPAEAGGAPVKKKRRRRRRKSGSGPKPAPEGE